MEEIEKIREDLYIKKSLGSYKVVYPVRNEDGTINWFNLFTGGSYWNLFKVVLFVILILALSWSYKVDTQNCRDLLADPCIYLPNITASCAETSDTFPRFNPNISINKGVKNLNGNFQEEK